MADSPRNNYLENLPAELKMRIMEELYPQDLCSIALISKNLRTVALDPNLFAWAEVAINERFMKKLKRLGPKALVHFCARFSNIKSLIIQTKCLCKIPKEFLIKIFHKVERLDLTRSGLSKKQFVTLFKETINFSSLTMLSLEENVLYEVPTQLLAKAISKLDTVILYDTSLLSEQIVAILKKANESSSIIELDLGLNNFDSIPIELITKPIAKLEILRLADIDLSTEQIINVLEETVKSNSLNELVLGYNNFNNVPAKIISKAISKLKKADLVSTHLSLEQIVTILEETTKSKSLVELNIGDNNLEQVPKELLSKGISTLKKVDLFNTSLATEQLVAVLEETVKSNSLVELNLGDNDFTDVPVGLLSKAISTLEKVNMTLSDLPSAHIEAILEETINSSSLIELNLTYISNLKDVPTFLITNAISKLRKLDLSRTMMSTEKLVDILEKSIVSNSLNELSLYNIDLIGVQDEVIGRALPKLRISSM